MKPDTKPKKLSQVDMVCMELHSIDYDIDRRLKEYKAALDDHDEQLLDQLDTKLTELVVRRHYLDPKRRIENHY